MKNTVWFTTRISIIPHLKHQSSFLALNQQSATSKNREIGRQRSLGLLAPPGKSSSGRPFLKCRSESIWALPHRLAHPAIGMVL
ncbi:hypothetical protein PGT21_021562 [Puccinia graminis f. sp. tritici]|uniref:Uncharacterized protein n=1 Tax=Puccinia graminis f. sp. tritici TaxID=56615 RepID=A0A5B0S1C6_PUCGR|nr:hypothetical protein PGT21_021562 [Puccinia graminis f. sp. tritici]KAA1131850.1 hypothetical protein PGTUg99_030339 [Puccinia graminis f. sp. tritici]